MFLLAYGQVLGVEEAILKKSWLYVKSQPSLTKMQPTESTPSLATCAFFVQEIVSGFHSFAPYLPESLYTGFPSVLRIGLLPRIKDFTLGRRLMATVFACLRWPKQKIIKIVVMFLTITCMMLTQSYCNPLCLLQGQRKPWSSRHYTCRGQAHHRVLLQVGNRERLIVIIDDLMTTFGRRN